MESIQMLILAYAPALGTLITILFLGFKICANFAVLRSTVKDDKTINALLENHEELAELYATTMKDVRDLKDQVSLLRKTCAETTAAYGIDVDKIVKELLDLKDELARVIKENKEIQKNLSYTLERAPEKEV